MLSSSDKLVKRLKSEYNATTIGFSGWSAVPSHMLARRCDRMFPIVIIATIQSFYRWSQILVQKPCILYMDLQRNLQKHCIMFAVSRHILWSSKSDILRCVFCLFILVAPSMLCRSFRGYASNDSSQDLRHGNRLFHHFQVWFKHRTK